MAQFNYDTSGLQGLISKLSDKKGIIKSAYMDKIKALFPDVDIESVSIEVIDADQQGEYTAIFNGLTDEQIDIIKKD